MNRTTRIITASLVTMAGSAAYAQDLYRLVQLTTVNRFGGAADINDAGTVVGKGAGQGTYGYAWRWSNGTLTLHPGAQSYADGINNAGRAAGWYGTPGVASLFFPQLSLPYSGPGVSGAIDIADNGLVIGWGGSDAALTPRAWVPSGGTYPEQSVLGLLAGFPYACPIGLNEAGVIVGRANNATVSTHVAVQWRWLGGGAFSPPVALDTLGGAQTGANDINEDGVIAGWSQDGSGTTHAAFWDGAGVHDLGIADGISAAATAINDRGLIVGYVRYSQETWPCIWKQGAPKPLRGRIADVGDLTGVAVYGVNNTEWMCGIGIKPDGSGVGVLLLPICYVDCDTRSGVGTLDIFDFLCFQNRFAANDPYACDCDTQSGPGVCDIFDFLCFQNAFANGCP